MRNAYYILVFLTYVLLNGCTETERLDGEGILRMKVNVDSSIKVVTSRTVTDDEQAELEKNCEVRLYNGKGLIRYYKGLSEVPEELQLKSGAYNVKVTAGDSVSASFDKTYYKGMAPFEHSSGTSVRGGCHTSSMANRDIKVQLNRSALIAIRCDPQLKAYYERKVAEGKHKFSVLNAVRAKIAARCFAVVRRGTPYVALQI